MPKVAYPHWLRSAALNVAYCKRCIRHRSLAGPFKCIECAHEFPGRGGDPRREVPSPVNVWHSNSFAIVGLAGGRYEYALQYFYDLLPSLRSCNWPSANTWPGMSQDALGGRDARACIPLSSSLTCFAIEPEFGLAGQGRKHAFDGTFL